MKRKHIIRKAVCGIAIFSMTAMGTLSMTGCREHWLLPWKKKEKNKVVVKEDVGDLDLSTLHDESNGFQYRNTKWLIPENELEKTWSADIGKRSALYHAGGHDLYRDHRCCCQYKRR